jgi:hypothetical protein
MNTINYWGWFWPSSLGLLSKPGEKREESSVNKKFRFIGLAYLGKNNFRWMKKLTRAGELI